ncbi:MAG TPA: hypothetical protein VN289_20940, partial [Paraburkholderia sp.]|nr:hypothetical protein [Paraburkholderia sp.]
MTRTIDMEIVEARESIRQAAYELARSGLFDGWQDVWRALRARFSVERLAEIFESAICRLDIDQRCYRARNPEAAARNRPGELPVLTQGAYSQRASVKHLAPERNSRKSDRLARRIHALLADGSEFTAVELAQRLGA